MDSGNTDEQEAKKLRRAVRKQLGKLMYQAPTLASLPRVVPVGYQEPAPEKAPASPLRDIRQGRSQSIRELAESSGISASTIYRIEQGKTEPRPFVAYALSRALECSPWEVVEFRDVMQSVSLPK